ncbi:hypothetical protein EQG41_19240 [Billgrantia azerbaijanica]|nr:hypothetical protein EQG41_19240 [Halomonas azerbaijanica]
MRGWPTRACWKSRSCRTSRSSTGTRILGLVVILGRVDLGVAFGQRHLREDAFNEAGLFGNQNTVCKPTTPKWSHTVSRLKQVWRIGNDDGC